MTDSFQFIDVRRKANQLMVERPGEYFNLEWMGKVQINQCGKFNKKIHACCIVKFSFAPQKNLYSFNFCMYIFETGLERWHIYKLFRAASGAGSWFEKSLLAPSSHCLLYSHADPVPSNMESLQPQAGCDQRSFIPSIQSYTCPPTSNLSQVSTVLLAYPTG